MTPVKSLLRVTDTRAHHGPEMPESPAAVMKRVGGDPSLDFVNTVGSRSPEVTGDKLSAYADLIAFARNGGLIGPDEAQALARRAQRQPREAAKVLGRATSFRETLYRALRSLQDGKEPRPADLGVLNTEMQALRSREALVPGSRGLRWEPTDPGDRLDAVLWPVYRAAAALLTSGDLSRLRQCGGEGCGWLFLDQSKNRSRQWCTMEDCGNLAKVRRFRQRRRAGPRGRR